LEGLPDQHERVADGEVGVTNDASVPLDRGQRRPARRRPARGVGTELCGVTRDEAIDRLNDFFVVLATTNIRRLPTEVELGTDDGMPRACVLSADDTATIAEGCLGAPITTLGPDKLAEVCRAVDHATGC
jgi:mRNA interferase MazF